VTRPSIIEQGHLDRLAVGYGRQSTERQVEQNTGSRDYQLGQTRHPREWGWPEERICWLDDFGLSGAEAAHRPSYQQLRVLVREGRVGLVCVSDPSRLGRNAAEWLSFYSDCAVHRTLIAIDGKVSDPQDTDDWLFAALLAVLSEHGGKNIRDTLQHGRLAKLEKGVAVSYPPVGYDQGPKKEWIVTNDVTVRSAVETVFRVFFQKRSLHSTARELRRLGVKIPRRKPGHPIRWRDASVPVIADVLGNPNYTPDYYYRRRVDDPTKPRSAKGRRRVRKAKQEEMKCIRDHHDGYISRDQWNEIGQIFARNCWSREHAPLGEGMGLAQGLVRCGAHRMRRLSVHYKRGKLVGLRSHHYVCKGDWENCGPRCGRIPGGRLDDVVRDAVLARLSPPDVTTVRLALEEQLANSRAERRRREVERARLAQRVADLEAKLDAAGPENVFAVRRLAAHLQQATDDLARLDEQGQETHRSAIQEDLAMLSEAENIARNVRQIWEAPTTTWRDRKELTRILVQGIDVLEWRCERVRVRIKWVDGASELVADVWLPAGVDRLLSELRQARTSFTSIAGILNEKGIRTRKGRLWAARDVRQSLSRRARRARREADARRGVRTV